MNRRRGDSVAVDTGRQLPLRPLSMWALLALGSPGGADAVEPACLRGGRPSPPLDAANSRGGLVPGGAGNICGAVLAPARLAGDSGRGWGSGSAVIDHRAAVVDIDGAGPLSIDS